MTFCGMILAAGKGTRMKSELPKVLHPIAGRPLLFYPVHALLEAGAQEVVVVVGHGKDRIEQMLATYFPDRVVTAFQPEQRGTGHAVACGLAKVTHTQGELALAYGDMPLLSASTFQGLLSLTQTSPALLHMLTTWADSATGYGRIIRDASASVLEVKEERDCTEVETAIREVNPGVYMVDLPFIRKAVGNLESNNAQRELLLTDVVKVAAKQGGVATQTWDFAELQGVNDRRDLAACEMRMLRRIAENHALRGVTIRDLDSVYIDHEVHIEADATLQNAVVLRGACQIKRGAFIDVGCVLEDVQVGENAYLKPYTVATQSRIGQEAQLGPFAHVRPRSTIGRRAQIGNFVELKSTQVGEGSKANHLSYLGDGDIGDHVNIGAGTIFCNYDGTHKHRTVLEEGVFVGSDSQFVAPIKVGKNAYVGTATTVTVDVPEGALAIGRVRQVNKPGYAAELRKRLRRTKADDR
ncbi:MAG: bifunctional UDP-N-acetylglucosamine diphosphorylase/glucosamine-1-phosphate N-acetyltransferase GlmU [Myxococcales bacterium]|nr:bifunctional UDP-N-acetylglucosamine diphosphorylase/glucosamine-1-phosphate N-acetyltransferase GlmU [Myxococcales bacterium]